MPLLNLSHLLNDYQPTPTLLQERVILVTGAGDGIGACAAQTFAKFGATVILAGRTVQKLETVYDRIMQDSSPEPVIYPIDLNGAKPEDYQTLAEALATELGRLDGLLHNASELGTRHPIASYKADTWQRVLNVNVTAQFLLTQALLPLLEQSPDGRILFTSSTVGRTGRAGWGAYAVSKFATEGMMQVLADELDGISSIRVNAINPGATRTRMRAKAYPAENPASVKSPDALMPVYLYLMGPDSRELNGVSFDV